MDVIDCIRKRKSIRKYSSKEVDQDSVGLILDAGRLSPSSGNLQNWKFIIVRDDKTKEGIAEACFEQYWMTTAPIFIVVCAEPEKAGRYYSTRGERLYSTQNCAAAVQSMILVATSLGLGSCWVSAFEEHKLSRVLDIPEKVRPQTILTIGYPAEDPKTPDKYKLTNIVYDGKWGAKISDIHMFTREWSASKGGLSIQGHLTRGKESFDEKAPKVTDRIREKTKVFAESISKKRSEKNDN